MSPSLLGVACYWNSMLIGMHDPSLCSTQAHSYLCVLHASSLLYIHLPRCPGRIRLVAFLISCAHLYTMLVQCKSHLHRGTPCRAASAPVGPARLTRSSRRLPPPRGVQFSEQFMNILQESLEREEQRVRPWTTAASGPGDRSCALRLP